jgi:hypothetical protein
MARAICISCGQSKTVEYHHVARRLHPQGTPCKPHCLTVPACVPCHQILTVWDSERKWPPSRVKVRPYSKPWADRLIAGGLDILRLSAIRYERDSHLSEIADQLEAHRRACRYTVRPSRCLPDIPFIWPENGLIQAEMLDAMVDAVYARAGIRIAFTAVRRAG